MLLFSLEHNFSSLIISKISQKLQMPCVSHPVAAHLTVKHLVSCDDVQLHAVKVVPGKSEHGSQPTQHYPKLEVRKDTVLSSL